MNLRDKIELFTFISITIISIGIAVVDFLGLLDSLPWIVKRIPTLSLLMTGIIASYLLLERTSKLEKLDNIENLLLKLNVVNDSIQDASGFSRVLLTYSFGELKATLNNNSIWVDKDDFLIFWRDCIRECSQWLTVAYANRDGTWDIGGWAEGIVFGIQYERIMSGAEIKRVYVFNDEREYKQLHGVMKKQMQIGCGVKYLYKKDFLELPFVSNNLAVVGTIDFAIVNDSWVFRTILNETGHILKANAIRNEEVVKSARILFQEAFKRGKVP